MKLFADSRPKTFRPKKAFLKGTVKDKLHTLLMSTLGSGDVKAAVKLPPGENLNEWLAVNTLDFYNQINMLFGGLREHCTSESCPVMSAGEKYEYYWADGESVKKPIKLTAPDYIDTLLTWIQTNLDNEEMFPIGDGVPFPANFDEMIKTIFKRLFRVYAHIYYTHYKAIEKQSEEKHLNSCFKHFILFVEEFSLIDKKELAPLASIISKLNLPSPAE
eukprot:Opistho-2@42492